MCDCVQKEKIPNGWPYYDYVFLCVHGEHKHVIIIEKIANDSEAKSLAEQKCREMSY